MAGGGGEEKEVVVVEDSEGGEVEGRRRGTLYGVTKSLPRLRVLRCSATIFACSTALSARFSSYIKLSITGNHQDRQFPRSGSVRRTLRAVQSPMAKIVGKFSSWKNGLT